MDEAQRNSGKVLQIGLQSRKLAKAGARTLRKLYADGFFGDIYMGAYRTWGRPPKRPRVSRIPTETGGKTGKMRGILGKNAIVPQLIYAPYLYARAMAMRRRAIGTERTFIKKSIQVAVASSTSACIFSMCYYG